MKPLKITLAIIVVAAVCAGIFYWLQSIKGPEKVNAAKNQFTAKIEQEIEQLKAKPDSRFCKDFYQEVAFHINEFYKPLPPTYPFGRFGKTQSANDQWRENLEKNLYSVYADKFIKQAKTVFLGSDWNKKNRNFIQAEKNELKGKKDMHGKKFLVIGSPVYNDFKTIQTALNKYNEIARFIWLCRKFSYTSDSLSDRFPIAEVQSKIQRAASLRQNHLENKYVNNCTRLHDGLAKIPQYLFSSHVNYLDKKIDHWLDMYSNYTSQKDYSNNLYNPIRSEIEGLDNAIYNVPNFDSEYSRLLQKWSADNANAYNYSYPNYVE